jgi:hypothetical protein
MVSWFANVIAQATALLWVFHAEQPPKPSPHGGIRKKQPQIAREAWQHTEILLEPLNSAYDEIRISPEEADSVKVVAELMRVL